MNFKGVKPEHWLVLMVMVFGGLFIIAHRTHDCDRCKRGQNVIQRRAAGERGFGFSDYLGVGPHANQVIAYGSNVNDSPSTSWVYQRNGFGG